MTARSQSASRVSAPARTQFTRTLRRRLTLSLERIASLLLLFTASAQHASAKPPHPESDSSSAMLVAGPETNSPPPRAEPASSAAAFVDSIGVQTHMSYVDTPYADWPRVLAELQRLGVRHIRDALPLNPAFVKGHQQLAAAGIHCTCGFALDKEISAQVIVQAARAASDVEALEAPNECDAGTNCGGGGNIGIRRVTAVLPVMAEAGHALQVPVIGPSFTRGESYAATGSIAQWITGSNLHLYFGGRNPGTEGWGAGDPRGHRYGSFDWWIDQSALDASDAPRWITETGYESFDNPTRPGTIPPDVESTYLLRTLLLAWNHGIRRTFVYELLDEFPGSGYGLLRHDLSEKPAFNALRNLLSILRDTSPNSKPGLLNISIESGDPSLAHAVFQKADGSYDLILWLERSSYDADALHRITVPPAKVQVRLQQGTGVSETISFNGDGSTQIQKLSNAPSSFELNVDDRLQILRIDRH